MGQAQINVRTRACSRTSIARTKQAALTHNVRGKRLIKAVCMCLFVVAITIATDRIAVLVMVSKAESIVLYLSSW